MNIKYIIHKLLGHRLFWVYNGPKYLGRGKHRRCTVCGRCEWNWDHDYWDKGGWSTDMPPARKHRNS